MSDHSLFPDIIIRKGIGRFYTKENSFEASFEIIHFPKISIINTNFVYNFEILEAVQKHKKWELSGVIEGDIKIISKDLLPYIEKNEIKFKCLGEVLFGNFLESQFKHAQFPLLGFYNNCINIESQNWHIKTIAKLGNPQIQKRTSEFWNIQLEGGHLQLISSNYSSIQQFQEKSNSITTLLSLAVGNDVLYNRQFYYDEDNLKLEIWRRRIGYGFGVTPCIPDNFLKTFLEISLSKYESWEKKEKDIFISVLNYINSSSQGFLEDRLMRLCIAWESLASSWTVKKYINVDLKQFKLDIKKIIKDYPLPKSYDKEFIIDRIYKSLDWEKSYQKIIQLLGEFKLDYDKLGIDLKSLLKIRNDIAHSGMFRTPYSKEFLVELISLNKLALQIILLKRLGYNNLVHISEDGWASNKNIEYFFKNI